MNKVGNASYAFDKLFKDHRNKETLDEKLFSLLINMSKKKIKLSDEEYNKGASSEITDSRQDSSPNISTDRLVMMVNERLYKLKTT